MHFYGPNNFLNIAMPILYSLFTPEGTHVLSMMSLSSQSSLIRINQQLQFI